MLPFLQDAFGREEMPTIVPIILSSMQHLLSEKSIRDVEVVDQFVESLSNLYLQYEKENKSILTILAVDLAHQGQYFGDPERSAGAREEEIMSHDLSLLSQLESADENQFKELLHKESNSYNWDGFACIYSVFAALRQTDIRLQGSLADYLLTVREEEDCLVSFASMFWSKKT